MISKHLWGSTINLLLFFVFTWQLSARQNHDLLNKALADSSFNWKFIESATVRIYYQPDTFAEKHRSMFLRSASAAIDESLQFLGESEYNRRINVFYLQSREEMEKIVGHSYAGLANWATGSVFVVCNPRWRSFEKHEITHVLCMELWDYPHATSRWMIEGIAICCDQWCREYSVDEIAHYFLAKNLLPPLEQLFNHFSSPGEIKGGFYSASIIGFIRHKFGTKALCQLWINGSDNLAAFLGVDIKQLEALWINYLRMNVNKKVNVDIDTIEKLGCG